MATSSERIFPDDWYHEASNNYVLELEARALEQLMTAMYEAREQAEKCQCGQCQKRGNATHLRYWTEHHRVRSMPDMDQEEERLMNYALMRLAQIQEARKKKK